MIEPNAFINGDCMEYLPQYPDNYFDLAIVDPPYGDGLCGTHLTSGRHKGQTQPEWCRFGERFERYGKPVERRGGQWASRYGDRIADWDKAPQKEYFEELFRVSKNQIIWGGELLFTSADTQLYCMA